MINDIEEYFIHGCGRCERFATSECSTRIWDVGLRHLRRLCLDSGMIETVKWGHPCYMHSSRNIVILGALRNDFRISFFHASLLKDHHRVLEKSGPNCQHADLIRFTDNEQVSKWETVIISYIQEAIGYAQAGIKPSAEVRSDADLPEELHEALECDSVLAQAFKNLTPGRQRSYIINLNSAKNPETRIARIAKFRSKILAGKGAMER